MVVAVVLIDWGDGKSENTNAGISVWYVFSRAGQIASKSLASGELLGDGEIHLAEEDGVVEVAEEGLADLQFQLLFLDISEVAHGQCVDERFHGVSGEVLATVCEFASFASCRAICAGKRLMA